MMGNVMNVSPILCDTLFVISSTERELAKLLPIVNGKKKKGSVENSEDWELEVRMRFRGKQH